MDQKTYKRLAKTIFRNPDKVTVEDIIVEEEEKLQTKLKSYFEKRTKNIDDARKNFILAKWMISLTGKYKKDWVPNLLPDGRQRLCELLGHKPSIKDPALSVAITNWKGRQPEPEEEDYMSEGIGSTKQREKETKTEVLDFSFSEKYTRKGGPLESKDGSICSEREFIAECGLILPVGCSDTLIQEYTAAAIWLSSIRTSNIKTTIASASISKLNTIAQMLKINKQKRTPDIIAERILSTRTPTTTPTSTPEGKKKKNQNNDDDEEAIPKRSKAPGNKRHLDFNKGDESQIQMQDDISKDQKDLRINDSLVDTNTRMLILPSNLVGQTNWIANAYLVYSYTKDDIEKWNQKVRNDKTELKRIKDNPNWQQLEIANADITPRAHEKWAWNVRLGLYSPTLSPEAHGFWLLRSIGGAPDDAQGGVTIWGTSAEIRRTRIIQIITPSPSTVYATQGPLKEYALFCLNNRIMYFQSLGFAETEIAKIQTETDQQKIDTATFIDSIFGEYTRRLGSTGLAEQDTKWLTTFVSAATLSSIREIPRFQQSLTDTNIPSITATTSNPQNPGHGAARPQYSAISVDKRNPNSQTGNAKPQARNVYIPRSTWVIGDRGQILKNWPAAQHTCKNPTCLANQPTKHAAFECPIRYWENLGNCPGFDKSGKRVPSMWVGNDLTSQCRKEWNTFIQQKSLTHHPASVTRFNPDFHSASVRPPQEVDGPF